MQWSTRSSRVSCTRFLSRRQQACLFFFSSRRLRYLTTMEAWQCLIFDFLVSAHMSLSRAHRLVEARHLNGGTAVRERVAVIEQNYHDAFVTKKDVYVHTARIFRALSRLMKERRKKCCVAVLLFSWKNTSKAVF